MYESESEEEHSESEFYYADDTISKDIFLLTKTRGVKANPCKTARKSFVSGQKSVNTVKKTRSDIKTFERYLTSIGKNKVIENLPASELDHLSCRFFINARRVNNAEYEPDSLSVIQRSIQRFLVDQKSQLNILKDVEFSKSRQVLAAKRKELVNKGKGNKPNAAMSLTDEEENKLSDSEQFGEDSPEALQRALLVFDYAFWLSGSRWKPKNEMGRYNPTTRCYGWSRNACMAFWTGKRTGKRLPETVSPKDLHHRHRPMSH